MGDLQKTAERETLEELGIPANTLLCLGRLDDVPAVTPLGKTIIVVSPWVFLQVRQSTDMMLSAEVASAHWVDLRQLLEPTLATHAAILRTTRGGSTWVHRGLAHLGLASMQYPVVRLAYRTECSVQSRGGASYGPFASCGELRLWGLSLIMAGNLVDWARSAECPLGAPRLTE
ncbi:hypothetical protein IW150_004525 [Coemansia sp. RSA 2607]|nr:hypothetical protein IW150_004525 [Coemansia sp. RSA 2607]